MITAAKLAASLLLVLATVGLLWHSTPGIALGNPGGPDVPVWIATAALGWYQDFLNNLMPLLRRAPLLAAAYALVSILCVLSIFAAPFISNVFPRVLAGVLLIAGFSYYLIMFEIGGMPPKLATAYTILMNARFGVEEGTAGLYLGTIVKNLAFTLAALAIFVAPAPRLPSFWRRVPGLCVLLAVAGVAAVLWRTGGYTNEFPAPYSAYIDNYRALQADRDQPIPDVRYPGQPRSPFEKIVFIMDESLRADYISLNNPSIATTPFLVSRANEILNFGVSVSAANCSAESRLALRYAMRDKDVVEPWTTLRGRTTLWQYAHKAGFRTIYIDTVGTPALPYYGMTATELGFVDERIIVTGTPLYTRDARVADRLSQLLHAPGRMFIYVEKYGTHVPYDEMYPPSDNAFGADTGMSFRLDNRDQLIKQYKNAVRWSVDHFFSVILDNGLPPETLIIYTSDHGQSLSESHGLQTHCTMAAAAAKAEGAVPLFAITNDVAWQGMLGRAAAMNFDRASQYDITPTLLAAMGYDQKWLAEHFDSTLLEQIPPGRRRRFMAGGREHLRLYDE